MSDVGIEPKLEDSINQLQELYQKKYVEEKPEYSFEEWGDEWHCSCVCGGFKASGRGKSKTAAKKQAAFMMLVRLMRAAGIKTFSTASLFIPESGSDIIPVSAERDVKEDEKGEHADDN